MEGRQTKQNRLRLEVIRQLYYRGPASINEISKATGKSLPVITGIVGSLKEEALVINTQYAPSTGGRRAHEYQLNKGCNKYMLAVAIDQFFTRITLFNLRNEMVAGPVQHKLALNNSTSVLNELLAIIQGFLKQSAVAGKELIGLGIAMPGFVDAELGINRSFFGLGNRSVAAEIEKQVGCPVFIDNDSSAIALAELNFGAARDMEDVLVVNVGWGIGLGIVVNGKLFRGHNGFAGEFSHIPLADSDDLCSCGKRGCLEVDSSLLVLAKKAQLEMERGVASKMADLWDNGKDLNGDVVLEAANLGDQLAVHLLAKAGFLIGKGIATLIHIMNPEGIIISGRGALAAKILMAPIQQAVNEFCIPMLAEQVTIRASTLNNDAELLGAATLVMERIENL